MGTGPGEIFVSGRYAYVSDATVPLQLDIIDISDPYSPTIVGTLSFGNSNPMDIFVSGGYAYLIDDAENELKVIDIASSTAPIVVASTPITVSSAADLFVSGRYAYITDAGSNTLQIYDISGIEVTSAIVHSLEAGSFQTRESAIIGNNLTVSGGLHIGINGLLSQGPGAFSYATNTDLSNVRALSGVISDNNSSSIVDVFNISHSVFATSTLAADGIGTGLLFSNEFVDADSSASTTATSTARIAGILTDTAQATIDGVLTFSTKNSQLGLTEWMRLDNLGRLGIGSTTPWGQLSVEASANANDNTPIFVVGDQGTSSPFFYISGVDGNIGIGTTTPQSFIEFADLPTSAAAPRNISMTITGGGNGQNAYGLYNRITHDTGTGADMIGVFNDIGEGVGSGADIVAGVKNIFDRQIAGITSGVENTGTVAGGTTHGIRSILSTNDDATPETIYGTYFDGTTYSSGPDISYGHYVTGNSNSDGGTQYGIYIDLTDGTATKYPAIILGGNVGIGTTTPNNLLQVAGSTTPQFVLTDVLGGIDLKHVYASSTQGNLTFGLLNDTLSTYTEYMRIDANGNVGIGTTSPYLTLSVVGDTILDSNLIRFASSSAPFLTVDYRASATSTIPNTQPFAWSIATATADVPIFVIDTVGDFATTTINSGFTINSGAVVYDRVANETSIENLNLGPQSFEEAAGMIVWIDLPATTSSAAGDAQAYSAQIDSKSLLTVWSESDGNGSITDTRVVVGTSTNAILGSSNIPYGSLIVADGIICVDDGQAANCDDAERFRGGLYATSTEVTAIDLAENYPTKDTTLKAGDLVMLDPDNPIFVKKFNVNATSSSATTTHTFIGAISTSPGVLLGGFGNDQFEGEKEVPVTLSGRVPVKVNLEGGDIAVGDRLTYSSVPGVATKATTSGISVGIALEPLSSASTGNTIVTFIDLAYHISNNDFFIDRATGRVGIGGFDGLTTSTTPQYDLHVKGDIAANSFINLSSSSTKKDIIELDEEKRAGILEKIKDINIFSYRYTYEAPSSPERIGLIAEVAPTEVLSEDGGGVDIYKLATFAITGIKELVARVQALEDQLAGLGGTVVDGVKKAAEFTIDTLFAHTITVENVYAQTITTGELTVGDTFNKTGITLFDEITGEPFCFSISNGTTKAVPGYCNNINPNNTNENSNNANIDNIDTMPPVITILGANPARIPLGATYSDNGVTVTDNIDQNLGYSVTVTDSRGQITQTDVEKSEINLDTSTMTEYTITYTATDQEGNTGSATRQVIIYNPNNTNENSNNTNTVTIDQATTTEDVIVEVLTDVMTSVSTSTQTETTTSETSTTTDPIINTESVATSTQTLSTNATSTETTL